MKIILIFILSVLSFAYSTQEVSIAAQPKVFADRLVSAENRNVEYILPTIEGQDIVLSVDYPKSCSDCPAQFVLLSLPNKERPFIGERIYHWKATNGQEIAVRFYLSENGKRDNIKVEPPLNKEKDKETFFIKSKGGYLIRIDVSWKGTNISYFHMEPKMHPFAKW